MKSINLTIAFFYFSINVYSQDIDIKNVDLKNGLMYLYKNEICFYSFDKESAIELTSTNNNIEEFEISPDKRFLAYSKVFKYVDSPGIPGDIDSFDNNEVDSIESQTALYSIILFDLKLNQIIRKINPRDYEWISIDKWISLNELLLVSADGYSVNGWFKVSIDSVEFIDYPQIDSLENLNPLLIYDQNVRIIKNKQGYLCMIDKIKKKNSIILKENDKIKIEAISNDYKLVLWSEASREFLDSSKIWKRYYYKLYLKDLSNNNNKIIIDKGLSPMAMFKNIQFSPNNKFVSLDPYETQYIQLMDLEKGKQILVKGDNTIWINTTQFFYYIDKDLFKYDLINNRSHFFLKDIKNPRIIN